MMNNLRRTSIYKFIPLTTFSKLLEPSFSTHPTSLPKPSPFSSRTFSSTPPDFADVAQSPSPVDYSSLLQENDFHQIADKTINHLLEKLEVCTLWNRWFILKKEKKLLTAVLGFGYQMLVYGDNIDTDGFDIDYGNEVLTLKLGSLGTYVVNKQTPNRQIWLSSPVSGPSRFDWDRSSQTWIYRRNKASLFKVLESELEKLCGEPVSLS